MSKIIEQFAKYNKGREITKQEGNFSLCIWGSSPIGCYPPYSNLYYSQDFGHIIFLMKDDFGAGFFSLDDYKKPTRETFEKYLLLESGQQLLVLKDFYLLQEQVDLMYREIGPSVLSEMDTDLLIEKIKILFNLWFRFETTTLFSESLDEKLVKELYFNLNGDEKEFDTFFHNSSLLTFRSFASRYDEALLKFNKDSIYDIQWILGNYLATPNLKDCAKQIQNLISERGGTSAILFDMAKLDAQININQKITSGYKTNLNDELAKLFEFDQLCMYIRDIRKDHLMKGITIISNCLRELFPRLGLKEEEIVFFFYPDLIDGSLKSDNYIHIINKRKKGFLVDFDKEGIKTEYGDGQELLSELYAVMDNSFAAHEKNTIHGNIGCKGKVQAEVCVVLDKKDFDKFKDGDVLVTSMTRPEFVPLMKKASAVITDEGGITCHAAIISRELCIPCIIGTRNATRLLHDGDLVEVDAEKGIVTIVK